MPAMPSICSIAVNPVRWRPAFRIIPSRFPPISLFEEVADPADLEAVFQIESMTNDRLRDAVGDLSLVPPSERVTGPGSSFVMGAFTHIRPEGARFNDGTFGAFYAARERDTAIQETRHHAARFHSDSGAPPMELEMRVLRVEIAADFHDLRGEPIEWSAVYDPDHYTASQELARRLKAAGSDGIVYDSVRAEGGQCVAAYRPSLVRRCTSAEHLGYVWNGHEISLIYEKRILMPAAGRSARDAHVT